MKTFEEFVGLQERYTNLFSGDLDGRLKYIDQVWDILQKSYAKSGGLIVNGMRTKEELIKNIPFWKVSHVNGKVQVVMLYKDKGGRKRVAMGTDGTPGAKAKAKELMTADLHMKRSWGEISGPALGFLLKNTPMELVRDMLIPVQTVIALSPGKDIIPGFGNDPEIKSTDPFRDYWFSRKLADGKFHTKLAIGTPGNKMY